MWATVLHNVEKNCVVDMLNTWPVLFFKEAARKLKYAIVCCCSLLLQFVVYLSVSGVCLDVLFLCSHSSCFFVFCRHIASIFLHIILLKCSSSVCRSLCIACFVVKFCCMHSGELSSAAETSWRYTAWAVAKMHDLWQSLPALGAWSTLPCLLTKSHIFRPESISHVVICVYGQKHSSFRSFSFTLQ